MKDDQISNKSNLEVYDLHLNYTNSLVILKYNHKAMLHCNGIDEIDSQNYADSLDQIKKSIDWCVRKSGGQDVKHPHRD
jgi:hypothetical protein